jgi:hypothetical protein
MPTFPRRWSDLDMETLKRIRNDPGFETGYSRVV